jgi:acetyl-CoA C-acetyltransferase
MSLKEAKSFTDKLKVISTFRPHLIKPLLPAVVEPRTGLSMGEHTELMVKEWGISREEQDRLAYESHINAAKAYDEGFFDDLIFEYVKVKKDGITRKDTTMEKLAKLKPAFDKTGKGSLTAGNSTPMTDGAAAVLLSSEEWAREHGKKARGFQYTSITSNTLIINVKLSFCIFFPLRFFVGHIILLNLKTI